MKIKLKELKKTFLFFFLLCQRSSSNNACTLYPTETVARDELTTLQLSNGLCETRPSTASLYDCLERRRRRRLLPKLELLPNIRRNRLTTKPCILSSFCNPTKQCLLKKFKTSFLLVQSRKFLNIKFN